MCMSFHPVSQYGASGRRGPVTTTMLCPDAGQWRREGLLPQPDRSRRFLFEPVAGEESPAGRRVSH